MERSLPELNRLDKLFPEAFEFSAGWLFSSLRLIGVRRLWLRDLKPENINITELRAEAHLSRSTGVLLLRPPHSPQGGRNIVQFQPIERWFPFPKWRKLEALTEDLCCSSSSLLLTLYLLRLSVKVLSPQAHRRLRKKSIWTSLGVF